MNPHDTVHYATPPITLTDDWRKYVIQAATPNDTRLNFDMNQKSLLPKVILPPYKFPSYPKPFSEDINGNIYPENIDICFARFLSPGFNLWLEKIKICLHQPSTYGCIKINVWNYGSKLTTIPINYTEIACGQPVKVNVPVSLFANNSLISNVIDANDHYMINTKQTPKFRPFTTNAVKNLILANSLLHFGIQYAEGNAYGLKVFLVCWALKCDQV